mmetsp:Transcript_158498/g.504331  ORF Transcript_158498/g.504331 Transcript_158498/m.504331 type:complete len:270 (-) Transcript_158498:1947-2756(-)
MGHASPWPLACFASAHNSWSLALTPSSTSHFVGRGCGPPPSRPSDSSRRKVAAQSPAAAPALDPPPVAGTLAQVRAATSTRTAPRGCSAARARSAPCTPKRMPALAASSTMRQGLSAPKRTKRTSKPRQRPHSRSRSRSRRGWAQCRSSRPLPRVDGPRSTTTSRRGSSDADAGGALARQRCSRAPRRPSKAAASPAQLRKGWITLSKHKVPPASPTTSSVAAAKIAPLRSNCRPRHSSDASPSAAQSSFKYNFVKVWGGVTVLRLSIL